MSVTAKNEGSEGVFPVRGGDFNRAGAVSIKIKKLLMEYPFIPRSVVRRVAVVVFEAEVNIISYAVEGHIKYRIDMDSVVIEVRDRGPGIPDIELALQEGYSTADELVRNMGFGAGMGLPNIRKFSDNFSIVSVIDKGTTLKSIIYFNEEPDRNETC